MNNTNTGGPAFPIQCNDGSFCLGMTLRDYFAAKAMQGLMGRVWGDLPTDELFAVWSKSAYAMADAMLKAREA